MNQESLFEHETAEQRKPAASSATRSTPELVSIPNDAIYYNYRKAISGRVAPKRVEDSRYPQAQLEIYKPNDGLLQLGPGPNLDRVMLLSSHEDSAPSLFLSDPRTWITPDDEDNIAKAMRDKWQGLSEIEADTLDSILAIILKRRARGDNREIMLVWVDDVLRMRGLKLKPGGKGGHGGYTQEQRTQVIAALAPIHNSVLHVKTLIYTEKGKRRQLYDQTGRPLYFMDFVSQGALKTPGAIPDVKGFYVAVGPILDAHIRQTALLSTLALKYHVIHLLWEKRLIRYFDHIWRNRRHRGDYLKPITISTILREALDIESYRADERNHFASALRKLHRDGAIKNWKYGRQDGLWQEWTIIVEPPDEIIRHYAESTEPSPVTVNVKRSSGLQIPGEDLFAVAERIHAKREELHLSQRSLAKQLRIPQATLSRVECGRARPPKALEEWLAS
jgi:DNA-binding XRE family transcriptional regulator